MSWKNKQMEEVNQRHIESQILLHDAKFCWSVASRNMVVQNFTREKKKNQNNSHRCIRWTMLLIKKPNTLSQEDR